MKNSSIPKYQRDDRLELTVEKIVPRGLGLAFAEGLTVFVPLAAPGDKLQVRLNEVKGRTAFAEIEAVIEPSPVRGVPPCKYFGVCGGCDFQQMTYDAQLAAKVEIIRDSLRRIGKIDLEQEIAIIASPKPLAYRSRVQWHVNAAKKKIGYYKRATHDIIDVDHCPILDEPLDDLLRHLRSELEGGVFWEDEFVMEAASGTDESVSVFSAELTSPVEMLSVQAAGESYSFDARGFFQGNRYLVDQLIETAIKGAAGEHALDLYCGVGLFSLPLARRFKHVTGVEGNRLAVEFAQANAANAGLENLKFFNDYVGDFLASRDVGPVGLVLLDPPRSGTEKGVIEKIIRLRPRHISYVSCDPAILARDLRVLLDSGYRLGQITALDLFPQTHHVETVVRLTLT